MEKDAVSPMDAPRNDIPERDREPRFDERSAHEPWEPASPAEVGLDPEALRRAHEDIAAHYPKMYAFLVARDGKLVYERYYGGADAEARFDLRSATKSFTAAAVMLAEAQGALGDEATLGALFPGETPRTATPELLATTVGQLLTMTSGLHWQTGHRLGERWIHRFHRAKHWVRFALRLPVNAETRGAFQYRSVDSHLLSAAVSRAAGRSAADVVGEALFAPLGVAAPSWAADPQGVTAGHIGLALTGRDLAKFGWLHATGGLWEGRRLLPPEAVRRALTPQTDGLPAFGAYGRHWWIAREASGGVVRCALGHGGQLVFVAPEARLVAVFAASPKVSRWKHPLRLLERHVLPAVRGDGLAASAPARGDSR